jgi:hypothetical protein
MHADPSNSLITFPNFLHIVRHIRRSQGKSEDPASVELAARDVFILSGLRPEDGFITEARRVSPLRHLISAAEHVCGCVHERGVASRLSRHKHAVPPQQLTSQG